MHVRFQGVPCCSLQIPSERRRRVPTPVMMLYGRGWFKSRHALELVLHDGAKQDGCVLDLQAASSHATIRERRGTHWYHIIPLLCYIASGLLTYTWCRGA